MDPSDELVDVVDLDDRVIGVATRAEVRSQNLRHRCAEIAVVNSAGEIYVHRRMLAEWDFCPDSVELFGLWRDGRLAP